jgi:hypothetical protein
VAARLAPTGSSRIKGWVRASAGLGAVAGLLLAAAALAAGARPLGGVPAWAWLAVALACLLVREAGPSRGPTQRDRVRRGSRPS